MSSLAGIDHSILSILKEYCRVPSITNSPEERLAPEFFCACLKDLPYFRENPGHLGRYLIEADVHKREVAWAMIQGESAKTIVLMHHYDVVVTDNYAELKDLAFDIDRLEPALKQARELLNEEAQQDLASGDWIFGRGAADMKGGGAIQLALFDAYAHLDEQQRNDLPTLVLIAVPDEENLSAGMRGATGLLCQLKEQHGLEYDLMINSEPHQRAIADRGLVSQGSIAKLNAFVYVRGVMAHCGKVLEGINPAGLMARIVAATDLSEAFVDYAGSEGSIPPTWLLVRDLKKEYDISFPEACYGIFNVLNFHTGPGQVLEHILDICRRSLVDYVDQVNAKREAVSKRSGKQWQPFSWQPQVVSYAQLRHVTSAPPEHLSLADELAFRTQSYCPEQPLIVVGLCPPYYPGVTNCDQQPLAELIDRFSAERFGQRYDSEAYYTGISDLSYAMAAGDAKDLALVMANMIDQDYHIPFDQIADVSMECINIGPWGKDFHKPSERVLKEDLLRRTPFIIDHVIRNYHR